MPGKKRRNGRPRLTIVSGNGSMKAAPMPRAGSPTSIDGLPTRIYFSRASSTPNTTSLNVLRKYAEWMKRDRAQKIFVVGHANKRLWDKASLALADARARAVRDLLVWLGAHGAQVRRVTPSQLHRIPSRSTRDERIAHRFVELIVGPTDSLIAKKMITARRSSSRRRAA
ncbi:MAG: OmpA family protein [Gammaproteobacteria bacterium]|nr:OmpA family protein [Gammaproteobacteria bacterium]